MILGGVMDFSKTSVKILPNIVFVMLLTPWLFQFLNMAGSQCDKKPTYPVDETHACNCSATKQCCFFIIRCIDNIGIKMRFRAI
jgi:hypothetical protein